MHWNNRVVRHADGTLELREVYYGEKGKPMGHADVCLVGDDLSELAEQVARFEKALTQPILLLTEKGNFKKDQ